MSSYEEATSSLLFDEVSSFLHDYWVKEGMTEAYHVAAGFLENIFDSIKENPDEGLTADSIIKGDLVSYVDAYADDEALTDALAAIVEKY